MWVTFPNGGAFPLPGYPCRVRESPERRPVRAARLSTSLTPAAVDGGSLRAVRNAKLAQDALYV